MIDLTTARGGMSSCSDVSGGGGGIRVEYSDTAPYLAFYICKYCFALL